MTAHLDMQGLAPRALLDESEAVVDMHGPHIFASGRFPWPRVIPAMEVVDHLLDETNRSSGPAVAALVVTGPVGRVHVLDSVDATLAKQGEQRIEACALVTGDMRAVVNDDIHPAHFLDYAAQEVGISLRADPNVVGRTCALGAGGVDVDPKDGGLLTKILAPHVERATIKDADLEHSTRSWYRSPFRSNAMLRARPRQSAKMPPAILPHF